MRTGARQDGCFILLSAAAPAGKEGDDWVEDASEDAPAFVGVVRWRGATGGEAEIDCTGRTRWVAYKV